RGAGGRRGGGGCSGRGRWARPRRGGGWAAGRGGTGWARGGGRGGGGGGGGAAAISQTTMKRSVPRPRCRALSVSRPYMSITYSETRTPSRLKLRWALRATSGSKVQYTRPTPIASRVSR